MKNKLITYFHMSDGKRLKMECVIPECDGQINVLQEVGGTNWHVRCLKCHHVEHFQADTKDDCIKQYEEHRAQWENLKYTIDGFFRTPSNVDTLQSQKTFTVEFNNETISFQFESEKTLKGVMYTIQHYLRTLNQT